MSASVPAWKRYDTGPVYAAFLQQAGGASVLPLTVASSVEFLAKNTGASTSSTPTSLLIRGQMTIASAVQGYVTYAWGASDLLLADVFNVEYEILWQDGTKETCPNDSYDSFQVYPDLENQ